MDDLVRSQVKPYKKGFICNICNSKLSRSDAVRRHMRNIHLSSDEDYHCPPCNKYFKNRAIIEYHITHHHKDWKGVRYADFATKKL